jgi:hypothetical protein
MKHVHILSGKKQDIKEYIKLQFYLEDKRQVKYKNGIHSSH